MLENFNKNSLRFIKCFKESGLTQIKFANSLETSSGHVNEILKGKKNASYALSKLAEALIESLPEDELTEVSDKATQGEGESGKGLKGDLEDDITPIDVFAFAGAGGPIELFEHEPIKTNHIPKHWMKPDMQAVLIRGRSMEPTIMDGAVVGIDTTSKQVVSGELYAIWLEYEGAVVKRLYIERDFVRVCSDNPAFKEMQITHEDITGDTFILGKMSWLMQSY